MELSWRTIGIAAGASVLVACAAAIVSYSIVEPHYRQQALLEDQAQIEERANRQRALFDNVRVAEVAAQRSFLRRLESLQTVDVSAEFDRLFPAYGDGTRRSDPDLFEGRPVGPGDIVYGLGGFIARENLTMDRMRMLLAAYHTVRQHGEASLQRFDNFYFFTPENELIIFAPQREDRLEFYRMNAPADFSFSDSSLVQGSLPANNPLGQTFCTPLTDLIYVQGDRQLTTGCHTPVRVAGRHLGAFGMTIEMQNYLANAVIDTQAGHSNMIVSAEGETIAHQDLIYEPVITPELLAAVTEASDSARIVERIRSEGRSTGAFMTPDQRIIAYAHLETPGWYFVTMQSSSIVHQFASRTAGLVFLFTLIGVFLQALVLLVAMNWHEGRLVSSLSRENRPAY